MKYKLVSKQVDSYLYGEGEEARKSLPYAIDLITSKYLARFIHGRSRGRPLYQTLHHNRVSTREILKSTINKPLQGQRISFTYLVRVPSRNNKANK